MHHFRSGPLSLSAPCGPAGKGEGPSAPSREHTLAGARHSLGPRHRSTGQPVGRGLCRDHGLQAPSPPPPSAERRQLSAVLALEMHVWRPQTLLFLERSLKNKTSHLGTTCCFLQLRVRIHAPRTLGLTPAPLYAHHLTVAAALCPLLRSRAAALGVLLRSHQHLTAGKALGRETEFSETPSTASRGATQGFYRVVHKKPTWITCLFPHRIPSAAFYVRPLPPNTHTPG